MGRVCQQGDQELEDGQELQLRKMGKGGSNRSWELGWFLRSRTGRIQTGAVIGTGRRVKQACTFPVCITSLPSEGLGKASLPAQAVGTLSSSSERTIPGQAHQLPPLRPRPQRGGLSVGMARTGGWGARSCPARGRPRGFGPAALGLGSLHQPIYSHWGPEPPSHRGLLPPNRGPGSPKPWIRTPPPKLRGPLPHCPGQRLSRTP